jgi:Peptidase family M28
MSVPKLILISFLSLIVVWCEASGDDSAEQKAMMQITGDRMAAHVKFLADDLLEGRGTATRGYDLAALYVQNQFQDLGLLPGANGSYYQEVPFLKSDLQTDQSSISINRGGKPEPLVMHDDYTMPSFYAASTSEVDAGVVFAGFGVTAPDQKYDDYASIDAKGKIVAIFSGAPSFFSINSRAHYSASLTKQKMAVAHGAVGILTMRTPRDEANSPWERSVRQSALSGYRWTKSDGTPSDIFPELKGFAYLNHAGLEKLFQGSNPDLNQVLEMWKKDKFQNFSLPITMRMKTVSKLDHVQSPNVVGLLEGSDPKLKNEYIIYTAHLDHLGISAPVNGDTINNGAYDNATGVAAIIETARAFASLQVHPKRSIIFLAVTGEEKGLQGADYFANNPPIPLKSIEADINTDMFLMIFPFSDAVVFGEEDSSLGPIAERALKTVGLKMTPDPAPDEVRFVRSDQYAFVKKGVPSISLESGFESPDPTVNGEEATRDWLRINYHSPSDDNSQKMHWESGEKLIRAAFLMGYAAANQTAVPQWNPGNFFGQLATQK